MREGGDNPELLCQDCDGRLFAWFLTRIDWKRILKEKQMTSVQKIDEYVPDYGHKCEVCGANHVVTAVKDGKVVYRGDMCGVCTWGESDMHDPDNWNKGEAK